MRIIKAKMKGKKVSLREVTEDARDDAKVVDLMARLKASLGQPRTKPGGKRAKRRKSA